jgi:ribosomal-protein-alanine N-acetyltransferase
MNVLLMDIQDTLTIREMRQEDIQTVQEIDRLSFSLPWPLSAFEYELCENPGSLLWVAEITESEGKKKVVGMLVIWLIIDEAHIATIAIKPEYRSRAIAKKLLLAGLKSIANMNIETVTLEVRVSNTPAVNLYRSFGFEIVGTRPRYYVDNHEDALIMTLSYLDQYKSEIGCNRSIGTQKGGR